MAKCRQCGKEFLPLDQEATRLFHAHRAGFCTVECDKKWGKNYDAEVPNKNKYQDREEADKMGNCAKVLLCWCVSLCVRQFYFNNF